MQALHVQTNLTIYKKKFNLVTINMLHILTAYAPDESFKAS